MNNIDTLIFLPFYDISKIYLISKYLKKHNKTFLIITRKQIVFFMLKIFFKNLFYVKNTIDIERIIQYNNIKNVIFTNHHKVNIRLIRFNKLNHILIYSTSIKIEKSLKMYDEIWSNNKNYIDKLKNSFKDIKHITIRSFFV